MSTALLLLLQLSVILLVARACGALLQRVGQPPVVGEMLAGLLLGPLVLAQLMPTLHGTLFAPQSLVPLSGLGTLGLVFFMFLVGLEARAPQGARSGTRAALTIGVPGIVVPLALGVAASTWLHPRFAPAQAGFWPFALFVAAAMSVTAFPVLARILKDRGLTRSVPGRLALGAAAIGDAFVWIFLALVLAFAGKSGFVGVLWTLCGGAALVALAFRALRPVFTRLLRPVCEGGHAGPGVFSALVLALVACAAFAEWIGLHAVFGAFVFGLSLPRNDALLRRLARRIEPLAVGVLMPVVFVLAGQHAAPQAMAAAGAAAFALVLAVAIVGKLAGCALGARISGYGWNQSLAVGSLMNARGLMELVVIRIGYDAGLIGAGMFTLLFGMTLVTTLMATPLLEFFHRRAVRAAAVAGARPGGEAGQAAADARAP